MELVYVEEGSFDMGSDDADALDDEKPVHRVEISRGFWLGRYPVTQGEYQSLMGSNPSLFQAEVVVRKGFLGSGRQVKKRSLPRHPVEEVCWEDAVAFCRKLTDRERAAGRLPSGYGYRLPTEAEWEYAARGGSHSRGYVHAGSDMIGDVGWHAGNSGDSLLDDSMLDGLAKVEGEEMEVEERHAFLRDFLDVLRRNRNRTHAVGGRCPNELGLHDMSGNVWEWCADWYGEYSAAPVTDPEGPRSGSGRVGRGGAWYNSARACRVTDRGGDPPGFTDSCLGFRVSLAPATR
jgi:formylglycine-generating enzyme required for sulfatase activity